MPDNNQVSDVNNPATSSVEGAGASATAQQDVNTGPDTSSGQSADSTKGLDDVIKATFEASQSSREGAEKPEEPEKPAKSDSDKEVEALEADNQTQESKPDQKQADDKGPIPYARFAEVNTAKQKAEQDFAQAKPLAEAQQSIITHCQTHNITPDEFAYWMQVAALDKADPEKALQMLAPRFAQWQSFTGDLLPQDLQQAVDKGEMTLDFAKRLAAAEGKSKLTQQQAKQLEQRQLEAQQQQWVQAMQRELGSWSETKRKTDVDFLPKADQSAPDGKWEMFLHRFASDVKQANVATLQDLVGVAERSYAAVQASVSRFAPRQPASKVLRSNQSNGAQQAAPKTLDEAIRDRARKHGLIA